MESCGKPQSAATKAQQRERLLCAQERCLKRCLKRSLQVSARCLQRALKRSALVCLQEFASARVLRMRAQDSLQVSQSQTGPKVAHKSPKSRQQLSPSMLEAAKGAPNEWAA